MTSANDRLAAVLRSTDIRPADVAAERWQPVEVERLDGLEPVEVASSEPVASWDGLAAVESWREFAARSEGSVPCLVEGLWPEAALGFLAAPAKAGKTWVSLSLAVAVVSGRPLFGKYGVPYARPVLYVALEGHRAGLRARIGALARGYGLDPETDDLDGLHVAYKPRGMDLCSPEWAGWLRGRAGEVDAALVFVDVLRRGARFQENEASEVARLLAGLAPLQEDGRSVALVHHFAKLSELSRERSPGERMSGSGALFGAADVGWFLTGREERGRRLRLEVVLRDLAEPEPIGLYLAGEGTGEHGAFGFADECKFVTEAPPGETVLKAPAAAVAEYVLAQGRRVQTKELANMFGVSDKTLRERRAELPKHGVVYVEAGRESGYEPAAEAPLHPVPDPGLPRTPYPGTGFPTSEYGVQTRMVEPNLPRTPDTPEVAEVRGQKRLDQAVFPWLEPRTPKGEAPPGTGSLFPGTVEPPSLTSDEDEDERLRANHPDLFAEEPGEPEPASAAGEPELPSVPAGLPSPMLGDEGYVRRLRQYRDEGHLTKDEYLDRLRLHGAVLVSRPPVAEVRE
ncbi:MAG: AAA family ATPase [Gaiellales bacterium]